MVTDSPPLFALVQHHRYCAAILLLVSTTVSQHASRFPYLSQRHRHRGCRSQSLPRSSSGSAAIPKQQATHLRDRDVYTSMNHRPSRIADHASRATAAISHLVCGRCGQIVSTKKPENRARWSCLPWYAIQESKRIAVFCSSCLERMQAG